ncbi:signal transduction histidine kinase [Caldicoprobacter guelmensis]|uniref:sensor histidine kinase n=1 Tax=Caldicoprobacter guelmensis TaxID=1170224 RepID=UPI001957281D|nr:ATP-binding protein [Caldicoprobacter guelmensis]MBM7582552.1 signal transduction histidine kinase [Caldicoprobacter guelmensis]
MKLTFRTKLILSFLSIITIPVIITLLLINLATMHIKNDPEIIRFSKIELRFQKIIDSVTQNYFNIQNYDEFYTLINPVLKETGCRLQVIDNSGRLLFDSEDRESSLHNRILKVKISDGFALNLEEDLNGMNQYSFPIKIDDKIVGSIIIQYDLDMLPPKVLHKVILYIGGSYMLGLISLVALIILLSWLISRSILVPLGELNSAIQSISQGNLDFTINYNRNDELGRLCQAFELMRRKLKESLEKQNMYENSRKTIIASISHDLRTPIASIKGYVEALQDGVARDPEKFNRYLNIIKDKTDKLDRLIDDLFHFAQIELGKLHMDFKVQNSRVMLEEILAPFEAEAQNGLLQLIVQRPLPQVYVKADSKRISQVIDNIIENSRRYIPNNGQIVVGAKISGPFLEVFIKDNGEGVAPEDLPHIFESFYRGEKSRSQNYGGIGLGLAICKHIIEEHGGRIWAESIKGQGTTLYFTLPIVNE